MLIWVLDIFQKIMFLYVLETFLPDGTRMERGWNTDSKKYPISWTFEGPMRINIITRFFENLRTCSAKQMGFGGFVSLIFGKTGPSLWKYRPISTDCPENWADSIPEKLRSDQDIGCPQNSRHLRGRWNLSGHFPRAFMMQDRATGL